MTEDRFQPDPAEPVLTKLDTGVPHIARVYDYLLGGKDNYAVDREAGEQFAKAMPSILLGVRECRAFLARAVRFLAAECGIRQFLDIGTGLPDRGQHPRGRPARRPGERGSSMSTTTRWCSRTRGRCSRAARGQDRLHSRRPARHREDPGRRTRTPWTSPNRSPSCCSVSCTAFRTRTIPGIVSRLLGGRTAGQLSGAGSPGQRHRGRRHGIGDVRAERQAQRAGDIPQP